MYLIMRAKYERDFITDEKVLKNNIPQKLFKEKENAQHYIHEEIPKILKSIDPEYWKGPDTNENHVQMILGKNRLMEEIYTILSVSVGD